MLVVRDLPSNIPDVILSRYKTFQHKKIKPLLDPG
jgi:hypothetical protein